MRIPCTSLSWQHLAIAARVGEVDFAVYVLLSLCPDGPWPSKDRIEAALHCSTEAVSSAFEDLLELRILTRDGDQYVLEDPPAGWHGAMRDSVLA